MTTVAQRTATINPIISALATAFTISHADDPAALQACHRAIEHLASTPVMEFDGVELRITSQSRRMSGQIIVTDGTFCSCEGAKHPWCVHRVVATLLTAEWALTQPTTLRAKIVEQSEPVLITTDAAPVRRGPMADTDLARSQDDCDDLFS